MAIDTVEEEISFLLEQSQAGPLSIRAILEKLAGRGKALLLILLVLPFCQPIPLPGLSTLFGLLIAWVGLRVAFGHSVLLPKFIQDKIIPSKLLTQILTKSLWVFSKLRHLTHPRIRWICEPPLWHICHGIFISLLGLFLALPLPIPFSNLIAAWPLFLLGLGLLESDGVFVCIAYSLIICWILLIIFVV